MDCHQKKQKGEVEKRLANILIGVGLAAQAYQIEDLDKAFHDRIKELTLELT